MRTLSVLFLAFGLSAHAADNEVKTKAKDIWGKVKHTGKKVGKGVKQVGKDVGRGTQEVFDPNDEDLRKK